MYHRLPRSVLTARHIVFALFLVLFASYVWALPPTEQQEVEQRQRSLLEEAARQRDDVARQIQLPAATATPTPEAAGPCFVVTAIRFEGAGQLDADAHTTLTSP
ncbi:hypothetical protein, partial [Aeromonas hydrophila]|uniref:hypothetical protein n=1 Tax=Aeromonas hydrophila TaxID=644 RepID=UPI001F425DBA